MTCLNDSDSVIKIRNLSYFNYSNINWDLKRGHIHAIVGGSGVGKSTFMRLFLDLSPFSGQIFDASGAPWDFRSQNIAVQFQNPALLSHLSIGANIYLPLSMRYDIPVRAAELIALNFMQKVFLSLEDFHKLPSECSGGMQKRAALARALILAPELLFLDEPTSGLDIKNAFLYDDLIKNFRDSSNLTVLMVSHDLERVEKIADMVTIILKDGLFTDSFANLKNSDNLKIKEFFRYYG